MWKLEFSKSAEKSVFRLDKTIQERIAKYLSKVIVSNNPRAFGKALTGNKKSLWRYRVGDYRVICQIYDNELIIIAIKIDHRKTVYEE
jgi:mRNA interferase RelE/StbE